MSANAFINRLHAWVRAQGGTVHAFSYPRSTGGAVRAVYLAPAGPARGLVVLAHATGNDLYMPFVQACRQLLSSGYRVFSFDLDGHGLGSTHRLSVGQVDGMLPEAIERARRCGPDGPLYLLGQSLGGVLCLRYLATAPSSAVAAAVLLSVPVSGRIMARPLLGELWSVVSPSLWRAAPFYAFAGLVPAIGRFKRRQYPLRFAPGEGGVEVDAYGGFVDDLVEASEPLLLAGMQRCPSLLLYGSRDALTPPHQAQALMSRLGSKARSEVFAGETHFTLALNERCLARAIAWFDDAATSANIA